MAASYFVDPAGNDADLGTSEGSAWATLAKAFATAKGPGDTVALRAGQAWAETLTVKGSGAAGTPILITSYGTGPRPIISAADIPTGWQPDVAVAGGDRVRCPLGFAPGYVHREDGVRGVGTVWNLRKQTTLAACTALHDWHHDGSTLYVVLATGDVPGAMLTVHATRRNACVNEFFNNVTHDLTLQNLHCRFSLASGFYGCIHFATNSVANTGIAIETVLTEWGGAGVKFGGQGTNSFAQQRQLTMRDCEHRYHREHGAQLIFLTDGSLVERTRFHGNGRMGAGIAMQRGRIHDCDFNENANVLGKWTAPATVAGYDHGLYLVGQVPNFDRASGNIVEGCRADRNGKAGFATDALSTDQTFHRCESTRNVLFGWMLEGGTSNSSGRNQLYHCVAYDNQRSGLHVINAHGPFDARNNQFYRNGRVGNNQDVYVEFSLSTWTLHAGQVYKHGHIDWNPVALAVGVPGALATRVTGIPTGLNQWSWDAATETLYVCGPTGTQPSVCYAAPVFTLDGNNYTPAADQLANHKMLRLVAAHASTTYGAVAELRAAGMETNGQAADPLYLDRDTGDFRLAAGSPSINAGVPLPTPYDSPTPDLGAFEYMPEPTTIPPTNAGTYTVVATVNDPNYEGEATGTLVISKSEAQVSLGNLAQDYDGTPRPVSVATVPVGLAVDVTYQAA